GRPTINFRRLPFLLPQVSSATTSSILSITGRQSDGMDSASPSLRMFRAFKSGAGSYAIWGCLKNCRPASKSQRLPKLEAKTRGDVHRPDEVRLRKVELAPEGHEDHRQAGVRAP